MLLHYQEEDDFVLVPPHLGIAVQNLIHSYSLTVLKSDVKGALVKTVFEKSPLKKKGLRTGDIVTRIGDCKSEYEVDSRCMVKTPYQSDKVNFTSLNFAMLLDRNTSYIEVFRKGKSMRMEFSLSNDVGRIRTLMPAIEEMPCLVFAGMVFTDLCANLLEEVEDTSDPAIVSFLNRTHMSKPACVLSAFHTPCSVIEQGYENLKTMTIIKSINKTSISNVEELNDVLEKLLKRFTKNPTNVKNRFINMHSHDEVFIIDLHLAFALEPLLHSTPGYPEDLSIIKEHLDNYPSVLEEIERAVVPNRKRKRSF